MYNGNRVRNIEIPENLFSNLGELRHNRDLKNLNPSTAVEEEFNPSTLNESHEDKFVENYPKMTNYAHRQEYRERINRMYEDINVIPADEKIKKELYFNDYYEKGIVIKPKISSLKQFWTEYRLISNEKNSKDIDESTLDNFDVLFEALTDRVTEINRYIDELKKMRANIDVTNNKLEEDRERLSEEKIQFSNYKEEEEKKLKQEKDNLKINFERLQTIIDDLDKKLTSIDE